MKVGQPRFRVGDRVVVDVPGKAENGMYGIVEQVLPYDGPKFLDKWMYTAKGGWRGSLEVVAAIPERWLKEMIV
jgi:hypothetical protein